MSDTGENHGASGGDPNAGNSGTGASNAGSDGGTQGGTGADMVPAADLARSQETAKALQSERDRLAHRVATLEAASSGGTGSPSGDGGSDGGSSADDLATFRRSILQDVSGVLAIQTAATRLQSEFPNADPSLFSAARLAEFGSPDALYLAAKDSHDSVTARVEALVQARETALREEMNGKYGNGAGNGNGNSNTGGTGDPTVEQLNSMSAVELDAYMKANPGKAEAVLRSASAAG